MDTTRFRSFIALTASFALVAVALAIPGASRADTAPPISSDPKTVSADVLPTPQIDGVVWTQVVAGNRVYVGGDFRNARPFGAAPGTNQVPRANMLAYDINSGELISSFAPNPNGQVLDLEVSPDGKTVYAGGSFTTFGGQTRYRLAAFDAASGALKSGFRTLAGSTVRAVAVSSSTVYFGGDFKAAADAPGVATQSRAYLAAASATTGALTSWNPSADNYIRSLTMNHDQTLVVAGGHFQQVKGQAWIGMAAMDPTSGQPQPWAANATIRNGSDGAAITSLTADANGILATGYTFYGGGNFEAVARLHGTTGAIKWMVDCRGDHHSAFAQGDVAYTVGHPHRCSSVEGGFEERWPRFSPGTGAYTDYQVGELMEDPHEWVDHSGQPAPKPLHFWPRWYFGTYTASNQGAWHVTGNDKYLLFGGEFIGLNGKSQQGLTRMVRHDLAPNLTRPVNTPELQANVVSYRPGEAHIGWKETYDRDNERLTYRVYRNYTSLNNTPVYEVASDSAWHSRGSLSFIDKGLTPGQTYDYLVIAFDPFGNRRAKDRAAVTIATSAQPQVYGDAVTQDQPDHYFRFNGSASTLADLVAGDDATSFSGVSLSSSTALEDVGDKSGAFNGQSSAYTATRIQSPAPNEFTIEAWIKSTDGSGGRIVGYSTHYEYNSDWADRHLYLDSSGRIRFGVEDQSAAKVTIRSAAGYDDGQWHHVAASLSSAGMKLYVDGEQVASNSSVTEGRRYTGSWRIGKDKMSDWSTVASDGQFSGNIDEVAIYPRALAASEIAEHVAAAGGTQAPGGGGGGGGEPVNAAPRAAFTSSVDGRTVSFDGSGSSDSDGSIVSYAWDFGDGSTGSGQSAQRTYAADGTYSVRLTVTDDEGATGSQTSSVVVSDGAPGGPGGLAAADAFGRSVSGGWGSADAGGAWSKCSTCSVAGGVGAMSLAAGKAKLPALADLALADADVTVSVSVDAMPTGSGTYLAVLPRSEGVDGYRARLLLRANGSMQARWQRVEGGAAVTLAQSEVAGLTFAAGDTLMLRAQALGTDPTQLRFKVWAAGQSEPAGWTVTASDADPDWQRTGAPGLFGYVTSNSTGPSVLSWDDLTVTGG